MCLDWGKKPEYLEETLEAQNKHAPRGRNLDCPEETPEAWGKHANFVHKWDWEGKHHRALPFNFICYFIVTLIAYFNLRIFFQIIFKQIDHF